MLKFNRNYEIGVTGNDGQLIKVAMPFTMEFDITRNLLNTTNQCNIGVKNLSELTRSQIRKDWYTNVQRPIIFRAGYGENLSDVFTGNVTQAWSTREGIDYITHMTCAGSSLAYTNSNFSGQFVKGTTVATAIRVIMESLKSNADVKIGAIGNFETSFSRGNSFVGSTMELLNDMTASGVFIDNNKIYALNKNECRNGPIRTIDSSFGILSTPIRQVNQVTFTMLFEPRLVVGQKVQLNLSRFSDQNSNAISQRDGQFNGFYKIMEIRHKGTMSPVTAGTATTSVMLWNDGSQFVEVQDV